MKSINLANVDEKTPGGDFPRLEAGAYKCVVTAVEDNANGEYLSVMLDIAEGEHAGYFSDEFYADKPFAHRTILSYKDANLGYLKHNLRTFTDSNPGFDAEAAIFAGRDDMLVGKYVGCQFREEEYYDKKSGEFKMGSPRPSTLMPVIELKDAKEPKPRVMTDAQKRQAMQRAGEQESVIDAYEANGWRVPDRLSESYGAKPVDVYDGDIPFM